ncbi:MAG: type 2 isopentenyl-diphosphate Delta-isomerase [Candidatus ainarchaeum sp.]|nr:type 2 isopentenyl-diphosphate Delta-isomerase [Candidatus ainarchaeum sp.]
MVLQTEKRKKEHIDLCVNKDVSFDKKTTLLECIELNYSSLPEIDLSAVDLSTIFLGKNFSFPFIVSAITGGAQVSKKINLQIAEACSVVGVGMGLGSMRAMIEKPSLKETYNVKKDFANIFVSGNLGVAQLENYSIKEIDLAVQSIEVDALAIHVNSAQEAMQPEGDTNFSNLITKISDASDSLSIPIYVKEVGHGISFDIASKLAKTNITAIDVQGAGGTSWTRVDSLRHKKSFGNVFRNIGLPTAVSIIKTKKALIGHNKKIIASGGIRNGLDAVKSIVLGADLVGNALPVLQCQQKNGVRGVVDYLENFKKEMEIASFLVGCKNISKLQEQEYFVIGQLNDWLK